MLASGTSQAYWELVPVVSSGITYQTNPRYISSQAPDNSLKDDSTGTFVDMSAQATLATPDDRVTLSPRLRKSTFLKDNSDLNEDDWYVDLSANHRAGRGEVGLGAGWSDIGVVTAEFESATPTNPDGTPAPDTGSGRILDVNATQKYVYVAPYLSYDFSTVNSIRLSTNASDTTYDQGALTGYYDYKNLDASATITHVLDPKNSLLLDMNSSVFESEQTDGPARNKTTSYGITIQYQRTISQTLSGSIMVGSSRSTADVKQLYPTDPLTGLPCFDADNVRILCSGSSDSTNFVGDINLRKRSEKTTLNFDISRAQSPSSNGYTVIQDGVRFYVDQYLSARLSGRLGVVYYQQSGIGFGSRKNDYFTSDATVTWSLTPEWSVGATYSYLENKDRYPTGNSTTENNRVYVSIYYRGVGIRQQ